MKTILAFFSILSVVAVAGCDVLENLPTSGCGDACEDSSDCTGDLICDETGSCAEIEGDCSEEATDDCLTSCNTSDDCSSNYICNSNGLCALDDADTCSE